MQAVPAALKEQKTVDAGVDPANAPLTPEDCAGLIEDAPVGIFLMQDGLVVHANRYLRELSGCGTTGTRAWDGLAAIHPDDRPLVTRQLSQCAAGGGAASCCQARLVRRDGGVRSVEIHARRIGHRGRAAILGSLTDVTERVSVDSALCEAVARMEESSRHRQLLSDILCHDLMNPVWVAENYLRLLQQAHVPESQRPLCDGIRRSLGKAREILADARTYLLVHGPAAAAPEVVDLGALVGAAAAALRPCWEERGQTVVLSLAPGAGIAGGPIVAEIGRQLLSNAIKYGPPGSTILVAVAAGPPVRLEVRDRGPGVPEEARDRIFKRFERMEKGPISGVGFGLAIARRVADVHGGRVWVEPNPGGGSVFVAEFPAAAQAQG